MVAAVRNEKDFQKAVLKIAYFDGTADSIQDNTFIPEVLVTAKRMNKTEKAAYKKEL